MDKLIRRLKYYGIGFGIGLIFVIVIFKQKGCSWTPQNRVKSAVFQRIVFVDSLDRAYLKAKHIQPKDLKKMIQNATLSFMDSKRHGNEKIYQLYSNFPNGKGITFLVALREQSFVVDIDFVNTNFKKYVPLQGKATPFLYTKKENWFSGKWKSYKFTKISASDAPEKITKYFLKNGYLDCGFTNFNQVQPVHKIDFFTYVNATPRSETREHVTCEVIWFQEKLKIKEIEIFQESNIQSEQFVNN